MNLTTRALAGCMILQVSALLTNPSTPRQTANAEQPDATNCHSANRRRVNIEFEGNHVFTDDELRSQMIYTCATESSAPAQDKNSLDQNRLDYDLRNVRQYMASKGYLDAKVGEPRISDSLHITVPVVEGKLFRVGEVKIEGNSEIPEQQIRDILNLNSGEIANGQRVSKALYEDLKKAYGSQGFIQYEAEVEPSFRDSAQNPKEGVADFTITIDEGKQFTVRSINFKGLTRGSEKAARRALLLQDRQIFNQELLEKSITRLNELGLFQELSSDRDVEFRVDKETPEVDLIINVRQKQHQ